MEPDDRSASDQHRADGLPTSVGRSEPAPPAGAGQDPIVGADRSRSGAFGSDGPGVDVLDEDEAAAVDEDRSVGDGPRDRPVGDHSTAGPVDQPAQDELGVLVGIEADLAAVEAAMSGLDRIDSSEIGGAAAAAQVAAIVGAERFDATS